MAASPDEIYQSRLTIDEDGTTYEVISGSNIVILEDGTEFTVGPDDLKDPDGGVYAMDWDIWQNAGSKSINVRITIKRTVSEYLTEDELLDAYLDTEPDATDEDIATFQASREAGSEVPEAVLLVDPEVEAWLEVAAEGDESTILVVMEEQIEFDLPPVSEDLAATDPVALLDQMEARVLVLEDYKTQVSLVQAPLADDIESWGGSVDEAYWAVNALRVTAPARVIESILDDDRVIRVEAEPILAECSNQGAEIREAHGIDVYLDDGVDGETGSGRAAGINDIYVAIIDTKIDEDHQAWDDYSGYSRLKHVWRYENSTWCDVLVTDDCDSNTSSTTSAQHGNLVSGQLIADLEDDQDTAYTSASDQEARSGMTTESVFDFIEVGGGMIKAIEKAISQDVDIANMSIGLTSLCGLDISQNDSIDSAYHSGVFWVQAAGNTGGGGTECRVLDPGAAAGAFTVGAIKAGDSPLASADIATYSPHGGDEHGRPLIKLVATGGREGNWTDYDNTYNTESIDGTSLSAPVVAGAVANLKDHLLNIIGTSFANTVGNLYATMVLMGDGQLKVGGTASETTKIDDLWGAGRLQMRYFDNSAMGTTWRARWCTRLITDSELATCDVNPNDDDENEPLSSNVDWFKAAAWWFEPNVGESEYPAIIRFQVCDSAENCYTTVGSEPQVKRLWLGDEAGGETWEVRLTGTSVPTSSDASHYFHQRERLVHVAMYFEDSTP